MYDEHAEIQDWTILANSLLCDDILTDGTAGLCLHDFLDAGSTCSSSDVSEQVVQPGREVRKCKSECQKVWRTEDVQA